MHQTSELWLKFAAGEVDEAAALMERAGELWAAIRLMRRAVLALDYVTTSLEMLEKMSPWEYQEIRVVLGHGSGFDSPGFRAVAEVTRRAGRAFRRLVSRRRPRPGRALPARTGVRGASTRPPRR